MKLTGSRLLLSSEYKHLSRTQWPAYARIHAEFPIRTAEMAHKYCGDNWPDVTAMQIGRTASLSFLGVVTWS